jgi:predicted nucleic acid-binding protein
MSQPPKVFVDSSVLMAASISVNGAARDLVIQGLRGRFRLCLSLIVLLETERNLARKAPQALDAFYALRDLLAHDLVTPPQSLVVEAGEIVAWKDAAIVAGAVEAHAQYIATYDRKHLWAERDAIHTRYAIIATTPDEILRALA